MTRLLQSPRRSSLSFHVLALLAVLVAVPAPAQTLADEVDAILTEADWNGVALVATPEGVAIERGYGVADVDSEELNTPETRFLIGSVTKQFTGALTLMLMEEGLLDLHVPIDTYLPDYPQPQGSQITIHHLLTHTSGIPSYTSFPDYEAEVMPFAHTPAELVALFAELPLEFEPGTEWSYSNSGYALIGYIIEAVTAMTYPDAIQDMIFGPFELTNTGYPDPDYEGIATGYTSDGTFEVAPYIHPSVAFSAGALYSTVGDLYRWDQLLYGDTVFDDPDTKALFFEEHTQVTGPIFYAYGWYVGEIAIPRVPEPAYVVGHDGSINGFRSHIDRFVEDGKTIVLFTNVPNPSNVFQVVQSIRTAAFTIPTVDAESDPGVPTNAALAAPYPNPVSRRARFTYALTEPSSVRVAIYDVLGREVAVVAQGPRAAGRHEVALDAARMAPGLYVVRLVAGGESPTRRLTVAR